MKKISFIVILGAVLTQACNKGHVDTRPENIPSTGYNGLSYSQINGNYMLHDSIHFIGNQAVQPVLPEYRHPISRMVNFNISTATKPASFIFDGQQYNESGEVPNEYVTDDKYYDIMRIRFSKDTVFINYFKREYRNDSSLNITVRGYKL